MTVAVETTLGEFTIKLNAEQAPRSVANFLEYVDSGFYEGTIFHRVIEGFMIQGGGFSKTMGRKATSDPIPNEATNGLRNLRGTIAMARTADPNSATSQFFVNLVDNAGLDHPSPDGHGYAVFGEVADGMETIDRIGSIHTGIRDGMRDVPVEPIVILSVKRGDPAA